MSSSDVTYDMDTCKVCESQRSWFAKKMRSLAKATENSFCNFILLIPAPSAHPSVYTIGEFLPDMKSLDSNEKTAAARDHLASASGGGLMHGYIDQEKVNKAVSTLQSALEEKETQVTDGTASEGEVESTQSIRDSLEAIKMLLGMPSQNLSQDTKWRIFKHQAPAQWVDSAAISIMSVLPPFGFLLAGSPSAAAWAAAWGEGMSIATKSSFKGPINSIFDLVALGVAHSRAAIKASQAEQCRHQSLARWMAAQSSEEDALNNDEAEE